jgi:hypothetical protein
MPGGISIHVFDVSSGVPAAAGLSRLTIYSVIPSGAAQRAA